MQYFAKLKNLSITEKGTVWVVWDHPEFVRLRELAVSKKAKNREILLYIRARAVFVHAPVEI